MSSYKLNINILSSDVKDINLAIQKITIMKYVCDDRGARVAWVSFFPFEQNEVSWESEYGVYVSSSMVQNGAQILRTSTVNPATDNTVYPFENCTFSKPEGGGKINGYSILNKNSQSYTFGLTQSVIVNGDKITASPLNAVTVLAQQKASFTPIEKIKIFLKANFNNGMVISNITSKALILDFTETPNLSIRYDGSIGQFVTA